MNIYAPVFKENLKIKHICPFEGAFGKEILPSRPLDQGMGEAVGKRTVFRPEDYNDFGKVADRVATGNTKLTPIIDPFEFRYLRNAIATGALLTSGRHLQHGDANQVNRNIEVFTNCSTAICSFAKFYLLLNGSGVGRAYDDDLCIVDWGQAPEIMLVLTEAHSDFPHNRTGLLNFGIDMQILPWGTTLDNFTPELEKQVQDFLNENIIQDIKNIPTNARIFKIDDSREGWAKTVEVIESMAFRKQKDQIIAFDFNDIRPCGTPIAGMQGRPASGPISLIRGLYNIRKNVIEVARSENLPRWKQALLVDHFLSVEVQMGGARRAARMATKSWRDPDVISFVRSKSEGGLWTANHSVMVDKLFWDCVKNEDYEHPLADHARNVFQEATRCSWINGEPGFINGDKLEDFRTGKAREKPIYRDGRDFHSERYQISEAFDLLAKLSECATHTHFPVTTNPCGEITLHVTGGYCVITDFAPLLSCPVPFESFEPGKASSATIQLWDARVRDSIRLGVRFLLRTNLMNALYGEEVRRTNRIGIGPTGLHEWAWMRFGFDFNDLLDEKRSAAFWEMLEEFSQIAKSEANDYAHQLGTTTPTTVTTIKPAGTTSKLFGITEGAHLPARRQYLRWVQFKGVLNDNGTWENGTDPLLPQYKNMGYPVKSLKTFPGMTVVGFPTVPLIQRLKIGDRLVIASEASPQDQYRWISLLEKYWIGESQGNQISYTLKIYTDRFDFQAYKEVVEHYQPQVRCCSVMPSRNDSNLGYEYLPEEEVSSEQFLAITSALQDNNADEAVDWAHLQCSSGVCPI